VNPKVSIIIPAFNVGSRIEQTLEDVLKQSYVNLEVIVVDDRSEDDTRAVVDRFADRDERIICVTSDAKGEAGARNTGIRVSSGALIACMDADDRYDASSIDTHVRFLGGHPQVSAVASPMTVVTDDGAVLGLLGSPGRSSIIEGEYFLSEWLPHANSVTRREALLEIGGYRMFPRAADTDLWYRMRERGMQLACLLAPTARYVQHSEQMTRRDAGIGRSIHYVVVASSLVRREDGIDPYGAGADLRIPDLVAATLSRRSRAHVEAANLLLDLGHNIWRDGGDEDVVARLRCLPAVSPVLSTPLLHMAGGNLRGRRFRLGLIFAVYAFRASPLEAVKAFLYRPLAKIGRRRKRSLPSLRTESQSTDCGDQTETS
jgi:GT2 family glycosyltransferase